MIAAGTDPAVAAELERRIQVIERDELHDESRQPFSARELAVYVAVIGRRGRHRRRWS